MTESPIAEQMVAPSSKKKAMIVLLEEDEDAGNAPLNMPQPTKGARQAGAGKEKFAAGSNSSSDDEDMLISKRKRTLASAPSPTMPSKSDEQILKKKEGQVIAKKQRKVHVKTEYQVKVKDEYQVETKQKDLANKQENLVKKQEDRAKKQPLLQKAKLNQEEENIKSSSSIKKQITAQAGTEDEEVNDEYRWWEDQQHDHTVKWTTLEHDGVYFPPEHVPHGIKMKYDGKPIELTHDAEEVATFFAGVIGTPYADNPTFQKNFFTDFKKILEGSEAGNVINHFDKCDFTPIAEHLAAMKEAKKNRTKEQKEAEKRDKDAIMEKYGFCKLDGRREKVGNFRVEPPGLFRGRGEHPKTGCLKTRVQPEQVTINLSEGAPVPAPPLGHTWAKVIHDNEVTWLANWVENINGEIKYVFLAAGSVLKGKSDLKKFEKARELKKHVVRIRRANTQELLEDSAAIRQRATAFWLIDHLALRAGNEKGDDEADTVGCCSLRVEHVRLEKPATVVFDFLGKDSIRYYNKVTVPHVIFKNLESFKASKAGSESLFDTLTTSSLNSYLNKLMPGLTAKVFRTFNASFTFQRELASTPTEGTVAEKILAYNRANRQVAVLCNHQRSVSKTHDLAMERLNDKIVALKYERQLVRNELRARLGSAKLKARTDDLDNGYESDLTEEAIKAKAIEADEREKEKNRKLIEAGKSPTKGTLPEKLSDDKLEKRFESLRGKIAALKMQMIDKDEGKQTALSTSKINYIDPRISAAWCYSHGVPIEKIFNRSLREKFKWAMEVSADWKF